MNENEIIMENVDGVEVMELIAEERKVDFGKIGIAVLAAGAVVALGYKCYKLIKEKKAKKALEADYVDVDENEGFEDEDFAE